MAQLWDNLKESCSYYVGPCMELRSSGLAFSAFTFLRALSHLPGLNPGFIFYPALLASIFPCYKMSGACSFFLLFFMNHASTSLCNSAFFSHFAPLKQSKEKGTLFPWCHIHPETSQSLNVTIRPASKLSSQKWPAPGAVTQMNRVPPGKFWPQRSFPRLNEAKTDN